MWHSLSDDLCFCWPHNDWQKNVGFESHRRVPPQGDGILVGWRNVELFALLPIDHVRYYVPIQSGWTSCKVSRRWSGYSQSLFNYHSNYVLHGSLLKFNIVWPSLCLSLLSLVSSLFFPVHETVQMQCRSAVVVGQTVMSRVIWFFCLFQLVCAIKESGFFHGARSTDFDAASAYVAFRGTWETEWRPVPNLRHSPFFRIIEVGRPSATTLA